MDHVAGILTLVANDGRRWFEVLIRLRRPSRSIRLTVAGETFLSRAICWRVSLDVSLRKTRGRDDRSARAEGPSARYLLTHFVTVLGPRQKLRQRIFAGGLEYPAHQFDSTMRRKPGILMQIHPVLLEIDEVCNFRFLGLDCTDNLLRTHIQGGGTSVPLDWFVTTLPTLFLLADRR